MDFKNMLERERLLSKKMSKTQSVTSQIDQGISTESVHIGPSDHVPWLNDRKWAYIRLEGRNFGDVPLNVELKLEVWDSPNSAGVIIDAVRCAKLALDRGIGGPLLGPSAYFMKSPPVQYHDDEAHRMVEEFAGRRVDRVRTHRTRGADRRIVAHRRARAADAGENGAMSDRRPPMSCSSGPICPTEAELRLCGDVRNKRVLDLGCGRGENAVALAKQGAHVIAVDQSADAARRRARRSPTQHEVRVEWHQSDVADLAFLRADSIDLTLAAGLLTEVDDVDRLFRQVHRVLRAGQRRSCSRTSTRWRCR